MTRVQLEWWILFGICVANKSAQQTQDKLNALLKESRATTPFAKIRKLIFHNNLDRYLRKHRLGQYKRISQAFIAAVNMDLEAISVERLEAIPGIGPKTARMIMLYYDVNANCVPLDTHILKYLATKGYKVPKSTPPAGKTYNALEQTFQELARLQSKTVRELDTEVWLSYAKKK